MSRVSRYYDSFKSFVNKRSCITSVNDENIQLCLTDLINNCDYMLPILMLTITNNQTKKNKVSFLGYYAASSVLFAQMFLELCNYSSYYINKFDINVYSRVCNLLLLWCIKSWNQNLENIKKHVSDDKINKLYSTFINLLSDNFSIDGILAKYPEGTIIRTKCDIIKHYTNNDDELLQLYKKFKCIDTKNVNNMLNSKMSKLGEFVVLIGWILGCGSDTHLTRLSSAGKAFGKMYQISNDFKNMDRDLNRSKDGNIYNYVLHSGIQESYEKFIESKQKFIEEALCLDIFSNTVKEIIDIVENKVDIVIDTTSPELKSMHSSM